jgi:hypothetical protein
MTFALRLVCLVGVVLLAAMLAYTNSGPRDEAVRRLALLVGVDRAWGESEASLKKRAVALSRWPHTKLPPEVAWWAALWARMKKPTRIKT